MGSHTDALLTAGLLTLLLVFPTASGNINYQEAAETDSPLISTETSTDVNVDVDQNDPSTVTVERHDTVYTVQETPVKRAEKLETPDAVLEIKKTNTTAVSVLTSPYGTLEKGLKNGKQYSSFTGANRTHVESLMNELSGEADEFRSMARQKMLPDVEVRVTRSKAADDDERAVIDNDETESVDLTGWTLENSDGDTYSFGDVDIPARGTMMVYAAEEEELNVTESEENSYLYATGTDWDYNSEQATLFNVQGEKVDEDAY